MQSSCPGCHSNPSRTYDEDDLCAECREGVDEAERLGAYSATLDDLEELLGRDVLASAARWVVEA